MKLVLFAGGCLLLVAAPFAAADEGSGSWATVGPNGPRAGAWYEGPRGLAFSRSVDAQVQFSRGTSYQWGDHGINTSVSYAIRTQDGRAVARHFQLATPFGGRTTSTASEGFSVGPFPAASVRGSIQNHQFGRATGWGHTDPLHRAAAWSTVNAFPPR